MKHNRRHIDNRPTLRRRVLPVVLAALMGMAAALGGCSKEGGGSGGQEDFTDTPVRFNAGRGVEIDARSGATPVNFVKESAADIATETEPWNALSIFATEYTGATPVWTAPASSPLFMNGVKGTVNAAPGSSPVYYEINYGEYKYYNSQKNYDFRLLYPAPGPDLGVNDTTQTGVSIIAATATSPPKAKVYLQRRPDLMIAKPSTTVTPGVSKEQRKSPLPIKFEHMLSLITITIQKVPTIDYDIYLQRVTFEGRTVGTLNIIDGEWEDDGYRWSLPGKPEELAIWDRWPWTDFVVPPSNSADPQNPAPRTVRRLFLFPTTAAEVAADAGYSYLFTFYLNENPYSIRIPETGKTWRPGYKYTYDLTVTDTDIYVEVGTEKEIEWELWQQIDEKPIEIL